MMTLLRDLCQYTPGMNLILRVYCFFNNPRYALCCGGRFKTFQLIFFTNKFHLSMMDLYIITGFYSQMCQSYQKSEVSAEFKFRVQSLENCGGFRLNSILFVANMQVFPRVLQAKPMMQERWYSQQLKLNFRRNQRISLLHYPGSFRLFQPALI